MRLLTASFFQVILAYIQHLLVHKKNIPFGAVFSYYQINQLSYLWSPEFYATLTTPNFHGLIKVGFFLFIPFGLLLATGVGPASAIAMQPRLGNFTVPDLQYSFNVTMDGLYPSSLLGPSKVNNLKSTYPLLFLSCRSGYLSS
jgi:hypothetical protein